MSVQNEEKERRTEEENRKKLDERLKDEEEARKDGRYDIVLCNTCNDDFCSVCANEYGECERCGSFICAKCLTLPTIRKTDDGLVFCPECSGVTVNE